ncbi:hypothetical protein Zmor_007271 [Zophobas morio]|uniref:Mpv17-like protein 2 n=1 Tax=Zophobas morio TaxID=2755281 RepID=A0AA38ITH1_9CUCU|nr:hypothetical protein Zmor_007271 [Zophobas morio]
MNTHFINLIKIVKTTVIPKANSAFRNIFSEKYLLYTNIGLSATLSGVGDCLEQYHEVLRYNTESWDKIRTRNMSIFGVSAGIFCHHWYIYLDRRLPDCTVRAVIKKVIIDQFVSSPVCIVMLFLTTAVLEEQSKSELWTEMKDKAWKLYAAEWVIWPAAQYINFQFLPTRYRVLYDNLVSVGYDTYTSYIKYIDKISEKNECDNKS